MISPKELYSSAPYRALDDRRKKLVSAILIYGQSFSAAARVAKLNQSREQKNPKVQFCLSQFGAKLAADAEAPAAPLDIYEEVRRLEWMLDGWGYKVPEEYEGVPQILDEDARKFWASLGHPITEIPPLPAKLPQHVIERYHAHFAAQAPTTCTNCGSPLEYRPPVPSRDVPEYLKYRYRGCSARCDARPICPASPTMPTHTVEVPPSEPQTSRCSRCGRTTPQGVGLCSDCAVGVNW
jgi:hypothetical protein